MRTLSLGGEVESLSSGLECRMPLYQKPSSLRTKWRRSVLAGGVGIGEDLHLAEGGVASDGAPVLSEGDEELLGLD